ncbi:hypothetical protein AD998_18165 [bacterium 336/3]|nr:hypothetical protein AD998_18165 [bacterium 336/3]
MKIILLLWLYIYTSLIFGQRVHYSSVIYPQDLPQWEYKDFIKYNAKKVSAFGYETNYLRKLKRKGTLLYQKELDKSNNKIFGINSLRLLSTHGIIPSLSKWKFENFYAKNGLLIKEIYYPFYDDLELSIKSYKEIFYDYQKYLLINQTTKIHQIDTFLKKHDISYDIKKYVYNQEGNEIAHYHSEKNEYFKENILLETEYSDSVSLVYEKKYKDSLLENITYYTYNDKIHSRSHFFYNQNLRIKTQIDSIWHYQTDIPYLEEFIEFEYSDIGKKETQIRYNEQKKIISTSVIVYDKENRLLSNCYSGDNYPENCSYQSYTYQNNLLKSSTFKSDYTHVKTLFFYNTKGLLTEERIYINEKLQSAVKYFYEYD